MMNQKPRLSEWGRALLLLLILCTAATRMASAQAPQQKFVAGQIVLYMQPGTPQADANAVAAKVNPASVTALMLQDCYVLELPANRRNDKNTTDAVTVLKQDARVRWCSASPIYTLRATVTPDDPRFKAGDQWGLTQINMPQAWVLQKGNARSKVAVIDSGFFPAHEDTKNTYALGSFDVADNDADITADGTGGAGTFDHGSATSGVVAASTNNAIGIAGVCWQGTNTVCLKIQKKGSPNLDYPSILNAYAYIAANRAKYNITTLNMSYGGPGTPSDTSSPDYVALKGLYDAGIVLVGASGNGSGSNLNDIPTAFPFVIAVSATDRNRKVTGYSDTGKIEITAPGGDAGATGVQANGVLVIGNDTTTTYRFEDGTSFASPHVAGVAGLLMAFPNMTQAKAIKALKDGANKTGLSSLPDSKYGYGVLDAYKSFQTISVSASITAPDGVDPTNPNNGSLQPAPVETFKPVFSFAVSNVPTNSVNFVLDPGATQITFSLTQLLAGTVANVSDVTITGDTTSSSPDYQVSFRYSFLNAAPFSHTIQITATNATTGTSATDTRSFNLAPHLIQLDSSNITFVSIPYFETAADTTAATKNGRGAAIDPSVTLYRWLNVPVQDTKTGQTLLQGTYAIFTNGNGNIDASLTPGSFVPTIDGASASTAPPAPLGVAYFIRSSGPISYVTYGQAVTNAAIRIPMHEGWNMVGDPYPFNVGFNAILVEKPSGERITIQNAVDQKMLLPHVYHYAAGQYTFQTLPDGTLNAWEGQWIYIMPRDGGKVLKDGLALTLIVPPAGVSKAAGGPRLASTRGSVTSSTMTAPRVSGNGSWAIRLEASASNLKDTYNYIGMSTRATTGDDFTKVPKPPKPSPYVSLGMTRDNSALGLLAQDLQPVGGVRTWNVAVSTDQPNTDIRLSWPDISTLPRNYRLTLTDTVNGQSIDLRNASSYQFNSGHNATTRSFTLTATPRTGEGGHALLTNIIVNPSVTTGTRAVTTFEIGYTVSQDVRVEASILSFNGHIVSNVGPTRAATSGNNKIVWNGLDNSGHTIPAGSYLLQLRAITTEGQVTRQVVPLVVTGR